jgi:O-antigen/teichoic acid export membrane protein
VRKYVRQLFGESVVYGLSGVVSTLIGMLLVPVFTRTFAPAEYGVVAVVSTTNALVSVFIVLGLDAATTTWTWQKPETEERRTTFSSWFAVTAVIAATVGSVMAAASPLLSRIAFGVTGYAKIWALAGLIIAFGSFSRIANTWFRAMRRPAHAVAFSLTTSLTTVGLSVLLVVGFRWGLVGMYLAQLASASVGFVLVIIVLREIVSMRAARAARLREMLRFSLPLVPASVLFWLMNSAASYFLNAYCAREEVGLYQIGGSIAGVLAMGTWAFIQAWGAFALSIADRPIAKTIYAVVGELFTVGGLFAALVLSVFAPLVLAIFTTPRYAGARNVVGILAVNVVVLGVPQVITMVFALLKKNGPFAWGVTLGAAVTVPLFFLLVPRFGKEGAAVAVVLGNGLVPLYLFREAQRMYPLPYSFRRMGISVVAIGAALVADLLLDARLAHNQTVWPRKIALLAAAGALFAVVYRRTIAELLSRSGDAEEAVVV